MDDDELRGLIELLRQENAETRRMLREDNAAAHEETRRHFDITAEAMRHEIGIISERVIRLDEKVDHLDEKMDRRFAEVEYAHIKLDTRVSVLEKR